MPLTEMFDTLSQNFCKSVTHFQYFLQHSRKDDLHSMVFAYDSYATFLVHAACVRQRSYTTRHFNILIVAMTVVGF